jgi:hypothetical protein
MEQQGNADQMAGQQNVTATTPHIPSTKEWVVILLISAIPVVNIIMLLIWAFSDDTPQAKANWAKATLIWIAIIIGLYILMAIVFAGVLGSLLGGAASSGGGF